MSEEILPTFNRFATSYVPTPLQAFQDSREETVPLKNVSKVMDSQSERSMLH